MKNKRILTVAAHPDDEILGCGGTIAKFSDMGFVCYTLILGEGATSRDDERNREKRINEIGILKSNIAESNSIIGVKETFTSDFADNRFDSVDLISVVKEVERTIDHVKPDMIFTHYANDMNIDHYITNRAVLTATRPMVDEVVKEVYAFEVLSSTEWNYPLTFAPDYYVKIDDYLEKKIAAMNVYQSELKDYPHPRSLKGIELNAEYWGMRTGLGKAEAFKTLRRCVI